MKDHLTPLQKLPKNVCNLAKVIVATGFEKLPKVLCKCPFYKIHNFILYFIILLLTSPSFHCLLDYSLTFVRYILHHLLAYLT